MPRGGVAGRTDDASGRGTGGAKSRAEEKSRTSRSHSRPICRPLSPHRRVPGPRLKPFETVHAERRCQHCGHRHSASRSPYTHDCTSYPKSLSSQSFNYKTFCDSYFRVTRAESLVIVVSVHTSLARPRAFGALLQICFASNAMAMLEATSSSAYRAARGVAAGSLSQFCACVA